MKEKVEEALNKFALHWSQTEEMLSWLMLRMESLK